MGTFSLNEGKKSLMHSGWVIYDLVIYLFMVVEDLYLRELNSLGRSWLANTLRLGISTFIRSFYQKQMCQSKIFISTNFLPMVVVCSL